MRARIEDGILYLHPRDVPRYQKRGSIVRNSYFWALRSIAARSPFDKPWEFESEVWFALNRMLISFFESGYLGTQETQLEFLDGTDVPPELRRVSTWVAGFESEDDGQEACTHKVFAHTELQAAEEHKVEESGADLSITLNSALDSTAINGDAILGLEPDQEAGGTLEESVLPSTPLPETKRRPRRSTRLG